MSRPGSFVRALLERGAAAVGDSYARAAQRVLTQYERLEDEAAERRYQRRVPPASVGTSVAKS